MTMKRWHLLLAAEVIAAAGLTGEASGQGPSAGPIQVLPSVVESSTPVVTCPPRRAPLLGGFWRRSIDRLEQCLAPDTPDPVPLGQSVYQTYINHVGNGVAARMILNDFDFETGGVSLNQRGKDKLPELAMLALRNPYRVIIERTTYEPALAEMRRQAVLLELNQLALPLPADRIVVASPLTPGLRGLEGQWLYQTLMDQTTSKGLSGGGGSSSGAVPVVSGSGFGAAPTAGSR